MILKFLLQKYIRTLTKISLFLQLLSTETFGFGRNSVTNYYGFLATFLLHIPSGNFLKHKLRYKSWSLAESNSENVDKASTIIDETQ